MSMEHEGEFDDAFDDPAAATEEGAEGEEQAFDPERERAAIRAEIQAEEQQRFNQDKAQYNRRFTAHLDHLKATGRGVDSNGQEVITDLPTYQRHVMGQLGGGQQQQAPPAPVPSPEFEPEKFAEWQRQESARIAKEAVEAALGPLQQQAQAAQQIQARQLAPLAVQQIRGFLTDANAAEAADDPGFQQVYAHALQQAGLPMEQWGNPAPDEQQLMGMEAAAGFALAFYRRQKGAGMARQQQTPQQRAASAQRGALGQIGSTPSQARPGPALSAEERDDHAAYNGMMENLRGRLNLPTRQGVTPEQYKQLGEDSLKPFKQSVQQQEQRRRAAGGRR